MTGSTYRSSLALGGSDAAAIARDYEAWAYERRLLLSGTLPPWLKKKPTDAMQFGTHVHLAILEPQKYLQNRVICPEGINFTTKEGRAFKADFEEHQKANPGSFLIKVEQAWAVDEIVNNFEKEFGSEFPVSERLTEVEYFQSTSNGWALKGTADLLTSVWLVDIKTTNDIRNIETTAAVNCYDIQLAHYDQFFKRMASGIIFIENSPPFRCRLLEYSRVEKNTHRVVWEMGIARAINDGLLIRAETETGMKIC